jgi:hypothetical protein
MDGIRKIDAKVDRSSSTSETHVAAEGSNARNEERREANHLIRSYTAVHPEGWSVGTRTSLASFDVLR